MRRSAFVMAILHSLRLRFRELLRSERGIALPTALFATIASFSFASAAVVASVDTQHGTTRDHSSKEAIAAADAGANVALMRLNRYAASLTTSTPCLGMSGSTLVVTTALGDGWCPEITGTVGGSSYAYRVSPLVTGGTMNVVAAGASSGVSRRVNVSFTAQTVGSVLSAAGVIGLEEISLDNNADIRVSIGTNGNVTVKNNANVCGNIRHGIGKKAEFGNNGTQCKGYAITEGNESLPPVSSFMPANIATTNDDYRLALCTNTKVSPPQPLGCQSDTYSGSWSSNVPWDPKSRTISTSNNATLTLGGGDYFVCRLELSNNSHLIMADGAHVRVFFDTPEDCGLKAGARQIEISNNAGITSTGYQPALGKFDVPGFYLMGSPTIPTTVEWSNNSGVNEFVLYAPNSNINLSNNATYVGVIAGKTVHLDNNAIVKQDAGFKPPAIGGATLYTRQSYVECTGATGSPPNSNC
jgi:hypothetical protein